VRRAADVGSVRRPSPGCTAMGVTRRNRPLPALAKPGELTANTPRARLHADSGAAHAIEHGETSGENIDQVFPVGRRLPVFAHRDERHVFPELLLQIDADPLLLLQIGRGEPGGAKFLDARTAGPAVYRLLAVG